MKKICFAVLTAVMAVCAITVTALAAPRLTVGLDADCRATVSVVTDNADASMYMIYILEPNTDMDNMVNDDGTIDGLYKLEQLSEGSKINEEYIDYTYSFKMKSDAALGRYTVVAVGDDFGESDYRAVSYFVLSDKAVESEALNEVKASPTESVLSKYQGTVWHIDMNDKTYKAHKSDVLASFAINCKSAVCGGDVQKAFELSCDLTELKYADKSKIYELLYKYEQDYGLTYCKEIKDKDEGFLKSFTDLRADGNINPIRNTAELQALLRNTEALSRINAAVRDTVVSILREYNDVLKLDLSTTLDKVNSYDLAKEIVVTTGKEYTSVSQVVTAVKNAVNKLAASHNGNGSGSGSGNSGSTVGGNKVNYMPKLTPDIMNTISPAEEMGVFSDLQNSSWAEAYIEYMNYALIMTGDGNGCFRPNENITREEFAKALITALQITKDDDAKTSPAEFADVKSDDWYYETVQIAYQYGIVNGINESAFGVGQPITRQDAATMVLRARTAMRLVFKKPGDTVEFTDHESIADYALGAVTELQKAGVLNGYEDGTFRPKNTITRAETAKLLYGMLDGLGKL